jgi:hypothetical protein
LRKTASKASSTLGFVRRNLKNCPISCRKTAHIALVRSVLEYGSVVWNPYLTRDIDKLERIQRNGARLITGGYKSRQEGAVTNMLKNLDLPTLQDRRTNAKLVFLYKVVEGLGPAIDPDTFIKPNRPKRQIRSVKFTDCVAQNIIDRQVTNNTRSFAVPVSKTNQYRNSFFVDTIVSWNKLPEDTSCAKIVECFKEVPSTCYQFSSSLTDAFIPVMVLHRFYSDSDTQEISKQIADITIDTPNLYIPTIQSTKMTFYIYMYPLSKLQSGPFLIRDLSSCL